jgi:glycine/D-amino acid oxidase-like deaminating enzyme
MLKEHGKLGKDLRVVVLEGRLLCSGATGRNGGHMKCSPYVDYRELKKAHGSSKAKAIVRFRMLQRQCILDVVESEGLQGTEAREVDTSDVFLDLEEWNKAKMMVEELRSEFSEAAEGISMMEGDEAQRVCAYYNTNIACPITHYNIRLAPAHNAAV